MLLESKMEDKQYYVDIVKGLAESTIRKLWIVIIILIILCGLMTYLYIDLYKSVEIYEYTQEVTHDESDGINSILQKEWRGIFPLPFFDNLIDINQMVTHNMVNRISKKYLHCGLSQFSLIFCSRMLSETLLTVSGIS